MKINPFTPNWSKGLRFANSTFKRVRVIDLNGVWTAKLLELPVRSEPSKSFRSPENPSLTALQGEVDFSLSALELSENLICGETAGSFRLGLKTFQIILTFPLKGTYGSIS